MSEQKHTSAIAPLRYWPETKTITGGEYQIALFTVDPQGGAEDVDALMRRIVACVNACEGIRTDQLERFPLDSFKECAQAGIAATVRELEMEKQRDELLAAAVACIADLEHYVRTHGPGPDTRLNTLRAAIAKCKQ